MLSRAVEKRAIVGRAKVAGPFFCAQCAFNWMKIQILLGYAMIKMAPLQASELLQGSFKYGA